MSLKTATLIAIVGVGLGMILSILNPYILEALRNWQMNAGLTNVQTSFYMNTFFQLRILIHDGSIILFLLVLFTKQK